MRFLDLLPSVLIGAAASARSMTPMAVIAAARLGRRATPGRLVLLDRPCHLPVGCLKPSGGRFTGSELLRESKRPSENRGTVLKPGR